MLSKASLPVLFAITLVGCGATGTGSSDTEASVTAAATTTTTTTPAQPKTLEAATATAQEWADRRAAGDYAGVWLLFDKQVRDGISQADYVSLSETCSNPITALPTKVVGVRLDNPEQAITRFEVMGFKISATVLYEDGQWLLAPEPEFAQDLGKPVNQIIAERKARGECDAS